MLSRDPDLYGFTLIADTVSRYRFTDMQKAAQVVDARVPSRRDGIASCLR
jgi:hypothetical protein